jgi:hypothetical protein
MIWRIMTLHGIVAHLLGDGDELDAVPGELADVELQLEVVAEEAREAVDDDDIEGSALRRARLDHALELGTAVVGGRNARFDENPDQCVAPCGAIGFALALLVGNRDVMLGLPRRRDAQIEGGAQRLGHGRCLLLTSSAWPEQLIEDDRRTMPRTRPPRLPYRECSRASRR